MNVFSPNLLADMAHNIMVSLFIFLLFRPNTQKILKWNLQAWTLVCFSQTNDWGKRQIIIENKQATI